MLKPSHDEPPSILNCELPRHAADSPAAVATKLRVLSLWGGALEVLCSGARPSACDLTVVGFP